MYRRRGWVLAVPRGCGKATCDQICNSIWDDVHTKDLQCIIPLHVYPDATNPPASEDNKKGLKTFIYRREECDEPRNCAPNFCCCASTQSQS
jgi:hypothetical protein